MRGKVGLVLLFTVLFSALASSATLNITTMPLHDLWISAFDPEVPTQSIALPIKLTSDKSGKLIMDYDVNEDFLLALKLKNGSIDILYKKFTETYKPNSTIEIDFYPEGYTPVKIEPPKKIEQEEIEALSLNNTNEEVDINKSNLTNNTEDAEISQTEPVSKDGFSIMSKFNSKNINYIGVAIFSILIVFFIIRPRDVRSKMKRVEKRIIKAERNVEQLKERKKKLFIQVRKDLIKGEEELIKMRGGSIPSKEDKGTMLKRLQKALKKKR